EVEAQLRLVDERLVAVVVAEPIVLVLVLRGFVARSHSQAAMKLLAAFVSAVSSSIQLFWRGGGAFDLGREMFNARRAPHASMSTMSSLAPFGNCSISRSVMS